MPSSVISKAVGLTAVLVLARSGGRTSGGLVNNNSTAILYWGNDPAVSVASGFPIFPRGSVTFSKILGDDTDLAFYVVSDTAGQNVRGYESRAPR